MRSYSKKLKTRPFERNLSLNSKEQIEIFVSCQDLKIKTLFPKHIPSVALYIERDGVYELKGKTEEQKKKIDNPVFIESFTIKYVSSLQQNVKFLVLATDQSGSEKVVGVVCTTLNNILEKNQSNAVFDIIKGVSYNHQKVGKLTLRTDTITPTFNFMRMNVRIDDIIKPSKKLFQRSYGNLSFQFLRPISGNYVPVFESEIQKSRNIEWDEIQIGLQKLCNGAYDKPIKLHVLNNDSTTFSVIGEVAFTLNDLIQKKNIGFYTELSCLESHNPNGVLMIYNFDLIENPHFFDYISAGLKFHLLLGIDYTISNGDPQTSNSLHSLKLDGPNEYEKAIRGVFESLLAYSVDKKVRMFGFGGREVSPDLGFERLSHCFPLVTGDNRIHATGLDGVLQVYRDSLAKVEFGSPSYLESLIHQGRKIARYLQSNGNNDYVVLTILTDGKCHDMADTINKIVEVSGFPLSIVIVGLGNSDFGKMEILGGGHGLVDKKGNRSQRSMVQFVQFKKFQNSPKLLGKSIMEKISDQVLEYMFNNMILPGNIRQMSRTKTNDHVETGSPRLDIEEDFCEEDKNKNISSLQKNQAKMNLAFFKTFEATTDDTDKFSDEERNETISSFYINHSKMKPLFLKYLDLKETSSNDLDSEGSGMRGKVHA